MTLSLVVDVGEGIDVAIGPSLWEKVEGRRLPLRKQSRQHGVPGGLLLRAECSTSNRPWCERLIPTISPKAISNHIKFLGGWCTYLDWCQ